MCLIFNLLLDGLTNKQTNKQMYIFKGHEWVWSFYTRVLGAKHGIHSLCKLLSSTSASQHFNCPIWKLKQWCLAILLSLDNILNAKYWKWITAVTMYCWVHYPLCCSVYPLLDSSKNTYNQVTWVFGLLFVEGWL